MARVALTKLLILIILAFIICLPDFFMSQRETLVWRTTFLCLPYDEACEEWSGERSRDPEAKARGSSLCDPCLMPGSEKGGFGCTRENRSDGGGGAAASWSEFNISSDPGTSWFLCETDTDMTRLHDDRPPSGVEVTLEVSVEVRLSKAGSVNLTLHGHVNHSASGVNSLYLHPAEEEEEDEEVKDEEEQGEGQQLFYCYLPGIESGNNTQHCVLQLANQTILDATVNRKLPWKQTLKVERWVVFTVLCLALLLVVLLLTAAMRKINQDYHGRPSVFSSCGCCGPDWSDTMTETAIQRGVGHMGVRSSASHYWTARLHHRGHPAMSSISEEEV